VAAFSSWDFFPYILNQSRNQLPVNSGYSKIKDTTLSMGELNVNTVTDIISEDKPTRHDRLTFMAAKSWLEKNRPRVLFLGLGETDEFAHSSRYDLYLQQAHDADAMIAELWHWVQTTPGYKDNTIFIITTDHGRGSKSSNWNVHGIFTSGSSQTWMACLGPGVDPLGEIKEEQQIYSKQLPALMGSVLGVDFAKKNGR
jgi:membrane-anchored protein YejM (alkaline phosphatase superfamily)